MTNHLEKYFEVALKITKEAGKLVRQKIWDVKTVKTKACAVDFVTETDQQVEKMLIDEISSHFPDHKFIGEESTAEGKQIEFTDSPTWIIDPIDGTMNFVHGNPNVCISIGLLINKVAEIGIIYNPVLEQLFTARRGQGAFYNDRPIKVSDKKEMSEALLAIEFGTSRNPEKMEVVLHNVRKLYPLVHGMRSLGSAAMDIASVAMGGADAYCEFGIHAWDMAAGEIIVREAGGVVIDPTGGPFDLMSGKILCASTKELAEELSASLQQYTPPRDL
ncbi:inositol monophosphatase 1-like [Homalodisca vitripennis]|uniref:inositol monophosphatase 1-like n=1 Tax=Homalodisca vitripennis TaxID=197043 RepID=UPI001EEBB143|nr:inositol monophosphatase 1-like [Homalodisca vitripennis]